MTGQNDKNESWRIALKNLIEYNIFCIVRYFISQLPLWAASSASAFLWRLIAPHLRRHKRARSNLSIAIPELYVHERERILLEMWDNLGRTFAEAFHLHQIADTEGSIEFNLTTDARNILECNEPAVFVSLHAGNWEVTAIAAERFKKPLIGVYKRVENPYVDREVNKLRSRFYTAGLHSRAPDTVKHILAAIKSGHSVAIMGDLRDSHGDVVPFFGLPSRSTNFPALLARRYNLNIVAIRAVRISPGHFRIDAEKLEISKTGSQTVDVRENTGRIQLYLEKWIREDPSLWMWGHRRWNDTSLNLNND